MSEIKTVQDLIASAEEIINWLPDKMEEVTHLDAEYHSSVREEWIDLNQINTERNNKFHNDALVELTKDLNKDAVILELGSGVGYDAKQFLKLGIPFGCYIVSEITPRLLEYSKKNLEPYVTGRTVLYCCLDANNLLISNDQVDAVFAIATMHHFPNVEKALAEIDRVIKPSAKIIFAMEPNKLWSSVLIALKPFYRRLFSNKIHSASDEEAEGFDLHEFEVIGAKFQWQVQSVTPVWFFTGFLHNGLEFLYRLLRMGKRIKVPIVVEKLLIFVDTLFFGLPFCNRLAWHYTVVFRKQS